MVRNIIGPVSSLGYSTGLCSFDGSELLIAMKCYFDESEGSAADGDTWITLAGLAAPDKAWAGFDSTWRRMLRERYPIAPYIHMWQIVSGVDPFERVNGWTKDKVTSLVSDAVEILANRDSAYALHAFSCRVNLSARQRLIDEGHSVYDPTRLCAEMCIALSMDWRIKTSVELCYFFFDRGARFAGSFRKQWLDNRTPLNQVAIDPTKKVWDIIGDIQEVDMERHTPIQAADMIAWSTSRDLANKLGELYDLDEYMGKLVTEHHAVIDEKLLREKYLLDQL